MEPFDEKATTWNRWVKRFETAMAIFGTSETMKAKYLLHFMGTEAYNKLCDKALPLIPEELQYDNICELLEKHYNPKPNEIFLNFKFHSRKQEPTESAAEYLVALRHLATGCGFGEYLDKALRNQFVYGIGNRKIQGRLLEKDDLTLDDAIHLANMFEQAEKGFQEMNKQQEAVDMVNMRKTREREKRVRETEQRARSKQNTNCDRCGSSEHNSNDCRHINSVCNFCRKRGHLRRVCFKARSTMKQISDGEVSGKEDSEQEVCKMESNGQSSSIRDKILCTLEVNDRNITFEVDTGAPVTIISLADAYKYFSKKIRIHEPDLELYSYCKTPIDCAGELKAEIGSCKEQIQNVEASTSSKITELETEINVLHRRLNRADILIGGLPAGLPDLIAPVLALVYPLNRLLHKEVPFNFDAKCKWAFEEVKRQVGSEVVLTHYDPRKKLTLAVDASPTGVGAVLSHEFGDGTERPIQFASQTLNATQRRYSQVDKEAYAVIFGVKKFFQYVYGREFTLITDNKAISQIFAPDKGLPVLSATRMQHYAVFLESFDYKIRLRKSKENGNADALSRLPVNECSKTISEIDQIEMELIENLPITVKELGQATKKDAEVRRLVDSLSYGRKCEPADSFGIDPSEFSLQQGCLLRGIRVYVPKPLRTRIIQELHSGHFGVSKMKSLARAYCWWKNLDKDIEKAVAGCYECQIGRPDVKKEPVHCWLPPKKVFERVHVDYAGPFLGKYFFVLVDAFSKWPEVRIVRDITTETTIEVCRSIFAQFGIPNILVSDHGTQFKSAKFQEFLKQNGIMHKLGAPYHPATNGQAERFIQTFKTKLKAMPRKEELQRKIDQILLAYRRAIHPVTNKSPAMTMFGRQIQSRLDLLLPNNEVRDPERQKTSRELAVGDAVMARDYMNKLKWKPGIVRERIGDLHYKVRLEDGRCWNRHIDQLRKINGRVMLDNEVEETHSASYEPSDLTLEKRENPTSMSNAEREATDECVISDNRDQSFATPPSSPGSTFIGFEEPAGNGEAVIRTNPRRNIRRPHRLNDYVIDTD
ncbi:uncharacterized protein LOC133328309 [Musca vetustissima]|uniref:uncharacterized protein LOC133328309 n=1 Tax=Musca vetustissima TaxID=27455 RepID=UPI002AB60ACA|nr:uncharacterized protein LOC133328309 [Musca vetustissima]